MTAQIIPFNPLDKTNLGSSVADALLAREPIALDDLAEFQGAGVYAIYYTGKFKAYTALSALNRSGQMAQPIYVGKAVPPDPAGGALDAKPGRVLYKRLAEHAESIRATKNLSIKDFHCRFLVVDDIWSAWRSLLSAVLASLESAGGGAGGGAGGQGRKSVANERKLLPRSSGMS